MSDYDPYPPKPVGPPPKPKGRAMKKADEISTVSETASVAANQLRHYIERIERLEEDRGGIADDIKAVYGEAKATGYDTKVLRRVIAIRKQDPAERLEFESVLNTYLKALGMAP